jgi:hypothetical protein
MIFHFRWLALSGVAMSAVIAGSLPGRTAAPTEGALAGCTAPEYRQFDFWAGNWDAFDADHPDKVVARARVDGILDGCVLREVYDGNNGLSGQSFSIYDTARRVWHQSWVTNRGQLLMIEGKFEAGQMVLIGADRRLDGTPVQIRGVWKRVEGGVQETAHTSADGGRTWTPLFDLIFRPHAP